MLIYLLCLTSLFIFIGKPLPVAACSCATVESVEKSLSKAHAVFSGEVLAIKEKKSLRGYVAKRVHLKVNTTWKGIETTEVVLATGSGGGDCGVPFSVGNEYIIYANESDFYGEMMMSTNICSRTVELGGAEEDLEELGQGEAPTVELNLKNTMLPKQTNGVVIGGVVFFIGIILIFGGYLIKKKRK